MGDLNLDCAQTIAREAGLELFETPDGLVLTDGTLSLLPDYSHLIPRLKQGVVQRELLVKASKFKGEPSPAAFDATAGLGEDSLLLAAAGFRVTLCESNPVIAALLRDALRRAASDPFLGSIVARMKSVEGDSLQLLAEQAGGSDGTDAAPFDLVYLDPMFPGRTKSAAVKKKFQLLHRLEQPCADERAMLDAAFAAAPRKIVVKRPVKGPYLAGVKPSRSLAGKAVRYDVVLPAKLGTGTN